MVQLPDEPRAIEPEYQQMPHSPRKTTWVVVADGAKALILLDEGAGAKPSLTVLAKSELDDPPTRAQGTDRPGRRAGAAPGQRSAMEAIDWHEFGESRFVGELAARLNRAAEHGRFDSLVLAAPPKVLGLLRPDFSAAVADRLTAEIARDLTGHPVAEIERHIAKAIAR
jgi:protein required for attachment to host cells